MDTLKLQLVFHGDLQDLLRGTSTGGCIRYPLVRRASIKDIIESLSVPHTEVYKIMENGFEVDQGYIPILPGRIDSYPHSFAPEGERWLVYREQLENGYAFLIDGTALKLAKNLRLLGYDTRTVVNQGIVQTAEIAVSEGRIILSRNRALLQLKNVVFGQLLRSEDYREQVKEVFARYSLMSQMAPFSRCIECNGLLEHVEKKDILYRLEPLTKKYYNEFKRCSSCKKVYWQGSHHEKMLKKIHKFSP